MLDFLWDTLWNTLRNWARHLMDEGDAEEVERASFATSFRNAAQTFYDIGLWEPISLSDGKVHYVLKNDPQRALVAGRLLDVSRRCTMLWGKLQNTSSSYPGRTQELKLLKKCLAPVTVSHIAQKPLGGYDVRAYAQGSWIFLELPTFSNIESGADGVNTTEERRRHTLWEIVLHELAHVAGHWEHTQDHEDCIRWLKTVYDSFV